MVLVLTEFDKTMPSIALKLLNKFASSCQLNVNIGSTYDATVSQTTSTIQSQAVSGLIEEYADNLRFLGDKMVTSGNAIVEGDKKVTIAAKGLINAPKVGDTITVLSTNKTYNIEGVGSMWSGQLVAVYVLHVRKT